MTRILFVDDNPKRISVFTQSVIGAICDVEMTAANAIEKLSNTDYDYVFLDYDLEEITLEKSTSNNNGLTIATFIAENKEKFLKTSFYIHSLNSWGGHEAYNKIAEAGLMASHKPGCWQRVSLTEDKKIKFTGIFD